MNLVDYSSEMGEIRYPEGFFSLIKALKVEEQVKFFRTTKNSAYSKTNWSEQSLVRTRGLEDDPNVKALIMKDGYIVGAMIVEWFSKKQVPVLPDQCVCTYYASDNDGAGYNEREDYTYLVCVPTSAKI